MSAVLRQDSTGKRQKPKSPGDKVALAQLFLKLHSLCKLLPEEIVRTTKNISQWTKTTIWRIFAGLRTVGMSRRNFHERYLSFVLLYFDFWTILVHGSSDNSSHFVLVNINILTNATSRRPVVSGAKIPLSFSFLPIPSHFDACPTGYELTSFPGPLSYPLVGENPRNKVQTNWRWELNGDQGKHVYERFTDPTPHSSVTFSSTTKLGLGLPNKVTNMTKKESEFSLYVFHRVFWDLLWVLSEKINQETVL